MSPLKVVDLSHFVLCRFWLGILAGSLCIAGGCGPQADSPSELSPAPPPTATQPADKPVDSAEAAPASPVAQADADVDRAPTVTLKPALLPAQEQAEGWISLFDGQTLFGWSATSQADWRVEEGEIRVGAGDKGLLCTTSRFADYVLRLEFRSEQGTNSGIFLHTSRNPEDPAVDCYELNIAGADNPFPTGSLVYRERVQGDFESPEWQRFEVSIQGAEVKVDLDGQRILEYTDPAPLRRGHIGLQFNQGNVAFRNIRLRPLGMQSLFNGQDLAGWKSYPEMASRFTVNDQGNLHVRDGRGQLETEGSYGDFVLQLQCQTHAAGLNSGIFFRCIPGETMMGYECQIQNAIQDNDRTRPVDCGTGGIFRQQNARYVVADDNAWFHLTLVADGPHVAAWVNGYAVSDWTDQRAADENPRKGLRLEPGTIMIQGHDPTTDISFRELRLAELAPRGEADGGEGG